MAFNLARVERGILGTRFAGRIRHFPVTESTNQLALWAAQSGASEGVWIADEQTAGRGRGGHTWHSTEGDGLYVSMLVLPKMPMSYAHSLPLAAGLAAQTAIRESTGFQVDLKWPNDLMIGNKKCGGILVESASTEAPADWKPQVGPQLRYAVIGVGINLNHANFPAEIASVATSLHLETGNIYAREDVLIDLLRYTEREVTELLRGWHGTSNGPTIEARYAACSTWVSGKRVRVGEEGGYTGVTQGLDARGFLQVRDEDGTIRTVLSGGVRPA